MKNLKLIGAKRLSQLTNASLTAVSLAFILSACGPVGTPNTLQTIEADKSAPGEGSLGSNPAPPPSQTSPQAPKFCSNLNFSGVKWESSLSLQERRSHAIALSLSGSFEGPNGWKNLTNNFDGMGMSAGLLNQTLGTSSLQPLLAQMAHDRLDVFQSTFASSRRSSILNMIASWQQATGWRPADISKTQSKAQQDEITSSPLDIDWVEPMESILQKTAASPASQSVSWAVANLYKSDGKFKTEWNTELKNLLGNPAYVSLQIHAANTLHRKALSYVERVKIKDLRTYLLMFDIVVQNGGISSSEFARWDSESRSLNTREKKLKRLVDIRVERSRAEYREDVRSRKYAIIDGTGKVHGSTRRLAQEYCYQSADPIL